MVGPLTPAGRLLSWFIRPFASQEPSFYRAITACLLAAGVFWQMKALNKTYTTELEYPLAWTYDARRYVPLEPLPASVPVTVTGQGWRLLRCNLKVGVRPAELRPRSLLSAHPVSTTALRRSLESAFENLQIKPVAAPALTVAFDRLSKRRLPLALAPADSVRPYTVRFTPENLTFTGPASLLAKLPNPYPVALPEAPAGSSTGEVQLPVPAPAGIQVSAALVQVRLQPQAPAASRARRSRQSATGRH
jgi:hypothetical protein